LLRLVDRFPHNLSKDIHELTSITREAAPKHGRSTYGEPDKDLTPDEIYSEKHAKDFIAKARRAREIVLKIFRELSIYTMFKL